MKRLVILSAAWAFGAFTDVGTAQDAPPTQAQVVESIRRGIDFLLKIQEKDGAWGSTRNAAIGIDEFWTNPETHRSWIVAVTALGSMAVWDHANEEPARSAYQRGVDYLLQNALVKRPSDWDVDNTWAYVYGLQGLAHAYKYTPPESQARREQIKAVGHEVLKKLAATQTPNGGWGYYDFDAYTHPGSWSTSFMTAVAVLAMVDAREAGFTVETKMFEKAADAVQRCRLPTGAYTYSVEAVPSPGGLEWIDQVKGSLGRIQVCNLALLKAGRNITQADLRSGLEVFFKEHRFLDIARKKPIPHEAYYLNSGYFYFFGHYYAAEIIAMLPPEDQERFWPLLRHHIIKTQEEDGAMWDYPMNSHHKPYGVAFSMLALDRSTKMPQAANKP